MKKIIMVGLLVCSLCAGGISAMAAGCTHTTIRTEGANISSWSDSHTFVVTNDNGGTHEVTCYVYHWVERITHYCAKCGYEIGHEDHFHENHSYCGAGY